MLRTYTANAEASIGGSAFSVNYHDGKKASGMVTSREVTTTDYREENPRYREELLQKQRRITPANRDKPHSRLPWVEWVSQQDGNTSISDRGL
jgi:hypothetical protein